MTRAHREVAEKMRDDITNTIPIEERNWAKGEIERHDQSAMKVTYFNQALGVIFDIAEAHADIVDKDWYQNKAAELREKVYKSAGISEKEETPIPRVTALETRAILSKLKEDLQHQ